MKLTVLQENLIKGLNTASRFVATRPQLPILNNVLLITDKGRLKISATNLETGVNLWLGANVEKEGQLAVPARILTEFVTSLPTDKVNLEVKESQLFLNCGSFKASFNGLPPAEFPQIPTLKGRAEIKFEGEALAEVINQVAFAAAADETRPVLSGVLLTVKNNRLTLVATDGYRLSVKTFKKAGKKKPAWNKIKEFKKGLVVPARTLTEVARAINDAENKECQLSVTPQANQAIFALPEAEIVSRLLEGSFPDWEKILPEESTTKLTLDLEPVLRAVRMAAVFARESANIVRFEAAKDTLKVAANTAQVGQNVSTLEAETEGKQVKIAFNSRYLLDFLNALGKDRFCLKLNGALNPGVFTPVKDSSFLHLIMPVRVQE